MADLAADWLKAKADYFTLTGEKKPRETVAKFFSTAHTNLSKSIKKVVDAGETTVRTDKDAANKAKAYKKAVTEFTTASASYLTLLQKLIDDEKKDTTYWSSVKDGAIVQQKVTTARLKGLKMLKTRLEDYEATFTQKSMSFDAQAQGLTTIQRVEGQVSIGLKKGFKRAAAASAAIKAKPTVATWNAEMDDGVRSLTTALGAFKTLDKEYTKQGLDVPADVTKELAGANAWIVKLKPWADGAKRTLDDGTDVLAELKPLMVEVKACMKDFATYLT